MFVICSKRERLIIISVVVPTCVMFQRCETSAVAWAETEHAGPSTMLYASLLYSALNMLYTEGPAWHWNITQTGYNTYMSADKHVIKLSRCILTLIRHSHQVYRTTNIPLLMPPNVCKSVLSKKYILNEFLIDLIHLKFGYFILYTLIYRLMERKSVSMYKTVHAER